MKKLQQENLNNTLLMTSKETEIEHLKQQLEE